jgi:hypothetical protein
VIRNETWKNYSRHRSPALVNLVSFCASGAF